MTLRFRALRLGLLLGILAAGLVIASTQVGPIVLVAIPVAVVAMEPLFRWALGTAQREALAQVNRNTLTSDQIAEAFKWNPGRVIDKSDWGILREGVVQDWRGAPLPAVQVTNSTPNEFGIHEKIWLRVPSRGVTQPTRVCSQCKKDIAFPPRTAREAIAWTFRLCEEHYKP